MAARPRQSQLHLFGARPVGVVLTAVELLTPPNTIKFLPGFTCESRQGKAGDWGRSGNSAAPVGFEDSLVVEGRFRQDVLERKLAVRTAKDGRHQTCSLTCCSSDRPSGCAPPGPQPIWLAHFSG